MARRSDVLRGTLDLMILKSLELVPLHGSGLARRLEQVTGGTVDVGPGTIFPALYRLEDRGLIAGRWGESDRGRRARFYALTAAGRRPLGVEKDNWERAAQAIARVLRPVKGQSS